MPEHVISKVDKEIMDEDDFKTLAQGLMKTFNTQVIEADSSYSSRAEVAQNAIAVSRLADSIMNLYARFEPGKIK